MMGHKQGVQARILQLNSKAFCIPCSSHTLNLVVADATKSSVLSIAFFGVLKRLYNLFSSSVQHWAVLKEHVKQLTLKLLSTSRCEAGIDSNLDMEMTLSEKRQHKKKRQSLYEGTEDTQSTPDETFRRDFFLPMVDTALRSLSDRFSRLKGVYDLYDFLFSKDNMKETINNGKLHERCKKLEQTLHDIDADDLALEINFSLYTFPDHTTTSPFDMLNYIYSEKLLDLYSK
ncbi:uncharacterized protein LOC130271476 isoform X2 [Hyla sarda]|nr:uncharacterized protein LOC130271476 isoform X2 [Hyla sarda]